MNLISGAAGLGAPFSVYTAEKKSWPAKSYAKSFLGCAFSCSPDGHLATCSHVVQEINEDHVLVVQHLTEGRCHKAEVLAHHSKYDVAFLKIEAKTPNWPSPILEEQLLASTVWAYGLYDSIIEEGSITCIPQVFSGTITATPRRLYGLATDAPFYQVSFPSLPGFSGSPLYVDLKHGSAVCGMMFQNRTTEIVLRDVMEYKDEKIHFSEKRLRGWDAGVAHTSSCILRAATELKIPIWK